MARPILPKVNEDEDTQEIEIESCPICGGIMEHVVGCPEMDKPR